MKITWRLETGYAGFDIEGEIDIEDDATDAEIQEAVENDMWNDVSLSWAKVDGKP